MDERPVTDPGSGSPGARIHPLPLVKRPSEENEWYDTIPRYFIDVIIRRNTARKNFIIAVTGDPGIRKSTWTVYQAERHEMLANNFLWDPRHQFVFNPPMFEAACSWIDDELDDDLWHDIVMDDPSGEYSADQWSTPMARVMTSYLQTTSRRRKKNIWFPLPTLDLLPKGARRITGYESMMKPEHPGVGRVHRVKKNHYGSTPEHFKKFFCFADSRKPKSWDICEDLAEAWRKGFYTKEKFQGKQPLIEKGPTLTDQTYEMVVADKDSYVDPDKGKVTARMIIGGVFEKKKLKISRKVADEVLSRLVYSTLSSRPGSSAPAGHSDTDSDPEDRSEDRNQE
jgi:hypothetical protein